jgi:hypothetical protein
MWLGVGVEEMELYDITKKLIGEINPAGATHIDDERTKNLDEHIHLVEQLIIDLCVVAGYKNRVEYSMKEMGEKADKALKDLQQSIS